MKNPSNYFGELSDNSSSAPNDPEFETEFSRLRGAADDLGSNQMLNGRMSYRATNEKTKSVNLGEGMTVLGAEKDDALPLFYEDFVRLARERRSKSLDEVA